MAEQSYSYFHSDIVLTGKHARYCDALWEQNQIKNSYFQRLVDLYAFAAIVGFRAKRKSRPDTSDDDKRTILTQQIIHLTFLQDLMKLFLLTEDNGDDNEEKVNRAFRGPKTEEEFLRMVPDAVSCIVVLKVPDQEPQLLLSYEYRYPAGHYLLSVPAGLIDPEDKASGDPEKAELTAARREIHEETGILMQESDTIRVVNPCAFSTPGMTDESNGIVCAVISLPDLSVLSQKGAVGSEKFDGFCLVTKSEAAKILQDGRDAKGHFYPVYTMIALMYFVNDMWK